MTTQDAHVLISLMIQELSSTRVSRKTLGNGEIICVIDKQIYIWNKEDWEAWRGRAKSKDAP